MVSDQKQAADHVHDNGSHGLFFSSLLCVQADVNWSEQACAPMVATGKAEAALLCGSADGVVYGYSDPQKLWLQPEGYGWKITGEDGVSQVDAEIKETENIKKVSGSEPLILLFACHSLVHVAEPCLSW